MKSIQISAMLLLAAGTTFGQQWEFGGGAGVGFAPGVGVSSSRGSATAGLKPGVAAQAFVSQNLYKHLSGEIHYGFRQSNLSLKSGGDSATFSGQSHVFHYDVVYHTNRTDSGTQFYVAGGGGLRVFRGTGKEAAYQPLSQFGYFTRTQQVKPMGTVAVGVKYKLKDRLYLRAEVRDYITMFPKEVITPAPGAKYGSLLNDLVPMVMISYVY